jgi:hypothetical protein
MAARKKTRRRPARRAARAKPKARPLERVLPNKPARRKAAGPGAKKPAAKPARARPRGKPAEAPVVAAPQRPAWPAPPTPAPEPHASAPGFAQSLALLASEAVRVGVVAHWFARGGVAQVALEAPLLAGERLHVRGDTSDFLASAASLRVNGADAARAEPGLATLALPQRARPGDVVYALRPPA